MNRALSELRRLFWYAYCRLFNRDQTYYWTKEWQEGERASEADIKAGRVETFDNMEDLTAWLTGASASAETYTVRPDQTEAT